MTDMEHTYYHGEGPEPKSRFMKELGTQERATAQQCELFLENKGNGFSGRIAGHQVQLTFEYGEYNGYVDRRQLSPEQSRELYIKYCAIAKAQSLERANGATANDPATEEIVNKLMAI